MMLPHDRSFRSLALLFACALVGHSLQAQSDSIGYVPRLNLVKVGMSSTVARTASVMYERVLNPELSVGLTLSYMMPIRPSGLLDLNTDKLVIGGDNKLTGVFITPEVKWFMETSDKRPAPRGLYLGAYLRFSDMRYTSSITATATTADTTGNINSDLQVDLLEYGIGPEVGYQWLALHDRLAFDVVFFAPRFSIYTLKVKAELNGDGALYDDLGQALEEALGRDIAPVDIELSKTGTTTVNNSSFGYRFGIKVGYAF